MLFNDAFNVYGCIHTLQGITERERVSIKILGSESFTRWLVSLVLVLEIELALALEIELVLAIEIELVLRARDRASAGS